MTAKHQQKAEAVAAAKVGGVVAKIRAIGMNGWKRMQPVTHIGNMLMGMVGTGMIPLTKARSQNDKGKLPHQRHPPRNSPAKNPPKTLMSQNPKR